MSAAEGGDAVSAVILRDRRWSMEADIDWQPPQCPSWLGRRSHRRIVATLLAGERLAEVICLRLAAALDDPAARVGLARQIDDERRHRAAFARYLRLLDGGPAAETALAPAFAAVAAWRGPPAGLLVANHLLLEGGAIDAAGLLRSFPCPLLARICRLVARDEARHVAFGRALLRRELAHLDATARRHIYDWSRGLWHDCAGRVLRDFGKAGPLVRWLGGARLDALWRREQRRLASVGLCPGP